jgi:DNA-binding NarL/FixJ family response regulator
MLNDEPDFAVVGQASTGEEAIELVHQHRPDLALLDISMPNKSGLEVAKQITTELPGIAVLILTMHEEKAFFFEALRAGATGYVLKGARSEEFLNAIRITYEGGVYLPPSLTGSLVDDYLDRHPQVPIEDLLTPREREVLALIGKGLTNPMIAERLTVSVNTIKTHRARIYEKLNASGRTDLIAYARRSGLLRD